ncbi:hypothetical protein [Nocardiopsis ansamitocini]|uniref:Uncharacterized protein n=1 Tax=Nocardiopsis ansamitocini TaxID=1670832 RepID=A0A9W6P621_9ACTN|nr:hypothetical protein [Nocardiopsis ansamitocini]GLU47850.1 hypothetical protein Nans01_22010 [Nocardiopsis ansamitocini]
MDATATSVRRWAEDILGQLAPPPGCTLTVAEPPFGGPAPTFEGSPGFTSRLAVDWDADLKDPLHLDASVVVGFPDGSAVGVELTEAMTEAEAVVTLADQLQDTVMEHTHGAPVPPCPGHGHPAVAAVVDGVASWTCPDGDGAHRPILTGRG